MSSATTKGWQRSLVIREGGLTSIGCLQNATCELPIDSQSTLTAVRYRRLRNFFAMTKHWRDFDPFFLSKAETYKSSSGAIIREPVRYRWV